MKSPGYAALLFLTVAGIMVVAACNSTTSDAPATADTSPEAVEPDPANQAPLTQPAPEPAIVFRNGLVVTATGADPIPGGVVVINNGVISDVGPEASVTIPDGATVIDLEGRTILPGLIDARASALLKSLQMSDGAIENIFAEVYLKRPLATGLTTLRATGWTREDMQELPELRAALEEYGNSIPTVVIAGASLAHSEGPAFLRHYPDQTVGVGTVEEARQITNEFMELGVDQVNFLMSSGPSLRETLEQRSPVLTLEMLMAIVEAAHAQGKPVVGQALFPEEALVAIEAGVDELTAWPSLLEPLPNALIEAAVSRSVPILSGFSVGMPQDGDVRRFLDAGGTLVFGTFAPNSGAKPDREFALMELNGMTPMEMILSATVYAANAVGLGDEVGTLEVGKQADIIVVDGNPFEDDFVPTFRKVVYVVNNGQLVVQPEE